MQAQRVRTFFANICESHWFCGCGHGVVASRPHDGGAPRYQWPNVWQAHQVPLGAMSRSVSPKHQPGHDRAAAEAAKPEQAVWLLQHQRAAGLALFRKLEFWCARSHAASGLEVDMVSYTSVASAFAKAGPGNCALLCALCASIRPGGQWKQRLSC